MEDAGSRESVQHTASMLPPPARSTVTSLSEAHTKSRIERSTEEGGIEELLQPNTVKDTATGQALLIIILSALLLPESIGRMP